MCSPSWTRVGPERRKPVTWHAFVARGTYATAFQRGDYRKHFADDVLIVEKHGRICQHIKSKRNLVLLVVSARMNFHNFAGPAVVRNLAKENPELVTQVVVVLTRPDQALSVRESKDLLSARLKLADLYINRWHVHEDSQPRTASLRTPGAEGQAVERPFRQQPRVAERGAPPIGHWRPQSNPSRCLRRHMQNALHDLISEDEARIG
ncbi:uncharacterized protein THITE_2131842 [Thermothielavioides terrestris NRRL 8126]|uniref:Uncharacterized protein n=1 Tax=Thermothielavioides terrestris (strain ATCC 38088 / NRRL 8126) TaxID=578455 RepID=G2RF79_THETT|nr:uncharacterized protein THITE_2131842 [Thermothielavioides terrestris NRRL 8126]AEO70362.1 hypothetical protein THITE_2131842 [Thermothielavioides terrestris NRRL 8126]